MSCEKERIQNSEFRIQKTEDRRQKTEDRRQKTEDRRQKTEDKKKRNRSQVLTSSRCKIGGFFSLFALKGQNRSIQGTALGNEANKHFKP